MSGEGQPDGERRTRHAASPGGPGRIPVAHRLAVVAVAIVVGAALYAARVTGVLDGPPALVVVGLLVVAAPVAATFSERVFLLGTALLGWPYLLWWWKPPFDRLAVTLAVAGAAVALGVGRAILRRTRVLPTVRAVDGLPLVAAGGAFFALRPWIFPGGPSGALATLIGGYDNLGHYDMWRMIVLNGKTIEHLAPPAPGVAWAYANYPQGFHSVAATVSELIWPGSAVDTGASLVTYSRTVALVMLVVVGVVSAGITALCAKTGRPVLAVPLVALVVSALVVGPGIEQLQYGFANFLVAAGALIAACVVAVLVPRVHSAIHVVALTGAVIAVAANWLILVPLLVPVVVGALLPLNRSHWRGSVREWCVTVGVVALGVVVVAQAALLVIRGTPVAALGASGGVPVPNVGVLLAITLTAAGLGVAAAARLERANVGRETLQLRGAVLSTGVLVLYAAAYVLGRYQVTSAGHVGYYLWKFLAAGTFFGIGLLVVGIVAAFAARPRSRARYGGIGAATASVAVAVAATQVFGYAGPTSAATGFILQSTPSSATAAFRANVTALRGEADLMYRAATVPVRGDILQTALVLPPTSAITPVETQQWFLVLHQAMTLETNAETLLLDRGQTDTQGAAAVAAEWLRRHAAGTVIVAPETKQVLESQDVRGTVLTW